MKIVGLVDDIFFIGKIEGIVNNLGLKIKFLSSEDIENMELDYVIVDMDHKDAFKIIEKFSNKALCFGSHVKQEQFDKARRLGCKRVYPRSMFFDNLQNMLE